MGTWPEVRETFPAVAASLVAIRRTVEQWASEAGAPPRVVAAAVLAINEAATNAIVHAYGGGEPEQTVRVVLSTQPGWLRAVVADDGSGLHPRRNSPGYGLGFAVIGQLTDELELHERDDHHGLELRLGFRIAP